MFARLRRRWDPVADASTALYRHALAQARRPVFYESLQVPDTIDGRFDLLVLHVVLLVRRLRSGEPPAGRAAQGVFDALVRDMDESVRELGAGDMGVAPRVKRMAQGYYGRQHAYETALAAGGTALEDALARNLYGTVAEPAPAVLRAMAGYVAEQARRLDATADTSFFESPQALFGAPPAPPGDAAVPR